MPNAIAGAFPGVRGNLGSHKLQMLEDGHPGPASYVQLAAGAAGDPLNMAEFGWTSGIEYVFQPGLSSNGSYLVRAVNPTAGPQTTVSLQWIDAITGLEAPAATDLSASKVSIVAIGQ